MMYTILVLMITHPTTAAKEHGEARLAALVLRGDRVPSVRGAGRAAEHGPEEAPALELQGTGVGGIEHACGSAVLYRIDALFGMSQT